MPGNSATGGGPSPGHAVYRLLYGPRSFALKWFPDSTRSAEVRNYALLWAHGLPTLPVHACTEQAPLLEDLATSPCWMSI